MPDLFNYNDPLLPQWRDKLKEINESRTVINNIIVLTEIPNYADHVQITGYTEVFSPTIPSTNQFSVDYRTGIVTFDGTVADGTTISTSYYGRGVILMPASRIWTHSTNPNVIETVQTMIDNYNNLNGVDIYTKFDPNSGHKHTGQAGDAPPIPAVNIPISDSGNLITATEVEGAIQEVQTNINNNNNKIGLLTDLQTTVKSSVVAAVNENTSQLADIAINVKHPPVPLVAVKGDGVTNDRDAFNGIINFAKSNQVSRIIVPYGQYLIDGNNSEYAGVVFDGCDTLIVEGLGATLLQGNSNTRLVHIKNSKNFKMHGFKGIGSTYGVDGVTDHEQRHFICITDSSDTVDIYENYATNFLGDDVYIGPSLSEGSLLNSEPKNVHVFNNFIKERYGDGVRSYDGGSRSRLAIAIVCGINIKVNDNKIVGGVDVEPNADGQMLINIDVKDNEFFSYVIPQSTIGTNYNYDEQLTTKSDTNGVVNQSSLRITGIPANPTVSNVLFQDNKFDVGQILVGLIYKADVKGNKFDQGNITLGSTTGTGNSTGYIIDGNQTNSCITDSFIKLDGNVSYTVVSDNKTRDILPVVKANSGFVDLGRNIITNNITTGSKTLDIPTIVSTTILSNNMTVDNAGLASVTNRISTELVVNKKIYNVTLTANNTVLDFNNIKSNIIFISGAYSIDSIINVPDGTEITVFCSTGTAFLNNSSKIRLKGGTTFTAPDGNSVITFIVRSGILFEKSRNV